MANLTDVISGKYGSNMTPLPSGAQLDAPQGGPAGSLGLTPLPADAQLDTHAPQLVRTVDGPLGPMYDEWRMPDGRVVRSAPRSGTRSAIFNGMTFGFGDELTAGANALADAFQGLFKKDGPSLGQAYDDNLAIERAKAAGFHQDQPVLDIAGNVLGGIAGGTALAKMGIPGMTIGTAKSVPGLLAQSAKVGAATGGLTGFGNGEGGFGNRLEGAMTGAAIGGAAGAVLPALAVPLVKAAGTVRNVMGVQDAGKMASQKLAQAFGRDNISLPDAAQNLADFALSGKPAALFDVGGENVRGLARAAAGTPGPAKQAAVTMLEGRQGTIGNPGQSLRIMGDVRKGLGSDGANYGQTFDDLLEQAKTQAKPYYDKLYSQNGGVVVSDTLDNLSGNPIIKDALKKGLRIASAEGDSLTGLGVTGFNEAGDPIIGQALTIKGWDYAKRGLDDMIETARRGGENEMVRALMSLKTRLTGEVDSLTGGAYKAARQAYAGPMAMRDAMELGRDVLKEDGGYEIGKIVAKMGASEKQSFLTGVAQAIRDKVMNTPDTANAVLRIFGTPALRDKLKAAFPDNASYMQFAKSMLDEFKLYSNARDVSPKTGSQTALRLGETDDMGGDMLGTVAQSVITGENPLSKMLGLVKNRAQGMNGATAESLTNLLFNPAVSDNLTTIQRLAGVPAVPTYRPLPYGAISGSVGGNVRDR